MYTVHRHGDGDVDGGVVVVVVVELVVVLGVVVVLVLVLVVVLELDGRVLPVVVEMPEAVEAELLVGPGVELVVEAVVEVDVLALVVLLLLDPDVVEDVGGPAVVETHCLLMTYCVVAGLSSYVLCGLRSAMSM